MLYKIFCRIIRNRENIVKCRITRCIFTKIAQSQHLDTTNYLLTRHAYHTISDAYQKSLKQALKLVSMRVELDPVDARYVCLYPTVKKRTPEESLRDVCKSYMRLYLLYRLSIQGQRGVQGDEIWRRILDVMLTSTFLAKKRAEIEKCTSMLSLVHLLDPNEPPPLEEVFTMYDPPSTTWLDLWHWFSRENEVSRDFKKTWIEKKPIIKNLVFIKKQYPNKT